MCRWINEEYVKLKAQLAKNRNKNVSKNCISTSQKLFRAQNNIFPFPDTLYSRPLLPNVILFPHVSMAIIWTCLKRMQTNILEEASLIKYEQNCEQPTIDSIDKTSEYDSAS
jgi:hypothetical protein